MMSLKFNPGTRKSKVYPCTQPVEDSKGELLKGKCPEPRGSQLRFPEGSVRVEVAKQGKTAEGRGLEAGNDELFSLEGRERQS